MQFKNRTPHVITLKMDGRTRVIEPDGRPARVKMRLGRIDKSEEGITIHVPSRLVGIENLPAPEPNTYLVVSQITAVAAAKLFPDRQDIVYPATSPHHGAERTDRGVLAVRRLIRAS